MTETSGENNKTDGTPLNQPVSSAERTTLDFVTAINSFHWKVASREWRETGFTDGVEDAQELSYEDFRALEKDKVSEETREWVEDKRIQYLENPDEDIYWEGWVEGALHFWNEIKDKL